MTAHRIKGNVHQKKVSRKSPLPVNQSKLWAILGISLVIVLLAGIILYFSFKVKPLGKAAGIVPISECKQNGWKKGTTYILEKDLTPADLKEGGNCFILPVDDVILECNGHSITGNGETGTGIFIIADGNTVRNCNVNSFSTGLSVVGDINPRNGNFILNNHFQNNMISINLENAVGNELSENNMQGNSGGIQLNEGAKGNTFTKNSGCDNHDFDLHLQCSISSECAANFGGENFFDTIVRNYNDINSDDWPVYGTDYVKCDQSFSGEIFCNDNLDNDGDSFIDSEDSDCIFSLEKCKQQGWVEGGKYILKRDLGPSDLDTTASCLRIESNAVMVECDNHLLWREGGFESSRGIQVGGIQNSIQHCRIEGFNSGIINGLESTPEDSDNSYLQNTLRNNNVGIMLLPDSLRITLQGNELNDNVRGIQFSSGSSDNIITGTHACNNSEWDVIFSCDAQQSCLSNSGENNFFTKVSSSEDGSEEDNWPESDKDYQKCSSCSNGIVEENEECDDGNKIDGDGCSSSCTLEPVRPEALPAVQENASPENVVDDSGSVAENSGGSGGGGSRCIPRWSCSAPWSYCNATLQESRTCTDIQKCDVKKLTVLEVRSCSQCLESWICGEWGECNQGEQARECIDLYDCRTSTLKPFISRNCTPVESSILEESIEPSLVEESSSAPAIVPEQLQQPASQVSGQVFATAKYIPFLVSGLIVAVLLIVYFYLTYRKNREG